MEDHEKTNVINELLGLEATVKAFLDIGQNLLEKNRKLRLKLAGDSSLAIKRRQLKKQEEEAKRAAFHVQFIARKLKNFEMAKKREEKKVAEALNK